MRYNKGDYFGELALINDAPRAATVATVTKCKVVSINRESFKVSFQSLNTSREWQGIFFLMFIL
jgi:CRP-like cAMP-binding protein